MSAFAKSIFDAAAEVEAAEMSIKHAILRAAEAGDSARIIDIVTRWLDTPPTEVLSSMELDPCGGREVTQDEHHGAGGGSTQS